MLGVVFDIGDGHLVRSPKVFNFVSVDFFRTAPAFRRTEDNHGPACTFRLARYASLFLNGADFQDALLERGCHFLVHNGRIVSFYEMGCPAITEEEIFQFFM